MDVSFSALFLFPMVCLNYDVVMLFSSFTDDDFPDIFHSMDVLHKAKLLGKRLTEVSC